MTSQQEKGNWHSSPSLPTMPTLTLLFTFCGGIYRNAMSPFCQKTLKTNQPHMLICSKKFTQNRQLHTSSHKKADLGYFGYFGYFGDSNYFGCIFGDFGYFGYLSYFGDLGYFACFGYFGFLLWLCCLLLIANNSKK